MSTTPGPNPLYALTPSQVNWAGPAQWRQIIKQSSSDMRCSTPAFLTEDLDQATQTVTVQIAIQEQVRTSIGPQWWDVPPIIKVPILIQRGGGYSVTLPLKKGDKGLLIFCDTCLDFWWANGTSNSPVAQNTNAVSGSQRQNEVRRHYVHDCGFLPGMYTQQDLLENYSTDSLQIRTDDGATIVDVAEDGATVTAANVALVSPIVTVAQSGGVPQALMNDNFFQWFKTIYMPSVSYVSVVPPLPANPETTVLKGQ